MICTRLRPFWPALAATLTLSLFASTSAPAQGLAAVARPPAAQSGPPARGFMWKAERAVKQVWLVGSLHLLTADFYPLPASIEQAFAKSNVLMEEIDMPDTTDPQLQA